MNQVHKICEIYSRTLVGQEMEEQKKSRLKISVGF